MLEIVMSVRDRSSRIAACCGASQNRSIFSGIQMNFIVRKRETSFERKTESRSAQILFHFSCIDGILAHIRTIYIISISISALIVCMVYRYSGTVVTVPAYSIGLSIMPSRLMV